MRFSKWKILTALMLPLGLLAGGCGGTKGDAQAEAPPPAKVERQQDLAIVQVAHPEQFPLAAAAARITRSQLTVTGAVGPDISRNVPVISLATGRVVSIHARLGDSVKKGQLLLRVQSADLSSAFSDYQKAVASEKLARTQLDRAQLLYGKGAISLSDLQLAEDVETKAQVDVQNTRERLRVLGADVDHPAATIDIVAPVSGVITDQQVTAAGGIQGLSATNPFTISDLTRVWILCDVYENDLPSVHVGETAEIRLNAYPNRVFSGRISNVGPVLDPSLRAAKVRIEVLNPGLMRIGMFVTATFHGQKQETHAVVPASAILHLHDRDWVYVSAGANRFRRVEVSAGASLPNGLEEIISGIQPGQQVVSNALVMQNAVEQ